MPSIQEPTTPQRTPFLSDQPLVEYWDDGDLEWKTFDTGRMYVDRMTLRLLNQGISEADLRYECGEISFEKDPYAPITPLDLDRVWIRITFNSDDTEDQGGNLVPAPLTVRWAGIIVSTEEVNRAHRGPGIARLITQKFTAVGMEWLMSRVQIVKSILPGGRELQYGLPFNTHSDSKIGRQTVKGNKHKDFGSVFTDSDENAEVWTGDAIVDYLLATAFPIGLWTWEFRNLNLLRWIQPVIPTHGRTLMDVLRGIASPRRALGSHVVYAPGVDASQFGTFTYRVDSMFTSDTTLPSGILLDANETIVNLFPSPHRDAFTTVTTDSSQRYEKVVATGARVGVVFSMDVRTGLSDHGWSEGQEADYKSGDPNVDPDDDLATQRDEHDRYRMQKLPRVFTNFYVPINWDGVMAHFLASNEPRITAQLYVKDMRFLTYMPLKVGWDYQTVEPSPTVSAPEVDEFRKPFVIFPISKPDAGDTDTWQWAYGTEISNVKDETLGVNTYEFSCRVRPHDRRLGIEVEPTIPQHAIASHITDVIDDDTSDHEPQLSFRDLIFTGYTQVHDVVRGEYPEVPSISDTLPEDIHYLRLGETAFFDQLVVGTVLDVIGGVPILAQQDVLIRDDRDYLKDVARVAYQWYGVNRIASQIKYNKITAGVLRGNLVGLLDEVSANAMVSSILWDFQEQRTEIFTHFAEPDFAELAAR